MCKKGASGESTSPAAAINFLNEYWTRKYLSIQKYLRFFFLACTEKTLASLPFHIIFKEWFSYLHQVTGLSSCQDSFTPKLVLEEYYEVMKKLAGETRMWGLFSTKYLVYK